MKILHLTISFFLYLTASSHAAPPGWFTSGQHPSYVNEFYFVGVGAGASYDEAFEQAAAQLSRQIEVHVTAQMNSFISSFSEDDREHITSTFKSVSESVSEASLKGAQVSEKAVIESVHYILLTIDKELYATGLRVELDQARSDIQKQYDDAETLLAEGKILNAIQIMVETGDAAAKFHSRAVLYSSISGVPYLTDDILSAPAILSKARKLIGKIKLEKLSGDAQYGVNGKLLANPLIVRASFKQKDDTVPLEHLKLQLRNEDGRAIKGLQPDEDGKPVWIFAYGTVPIRHLRLSLRSEDNRVIEKLHTDEDGRAEFWIYAFGEDKNKVTVSVDLLRIPDLFRKDFRDIQASFKYNIVSTPPMTFSIEVIGESGAVLDIVEDIVARSVQDAGHHVNDNAPFLLSGKVYRADTKQIDGLDGQQYLVETELILTIQERSTGEKIGTVTLTGKGLDKESENNALQKSYRKLKVSRKELAKTLANASEKLKPIMERLSREALTAGKNLFNEGNYNLALKQLAQVTDGEAAVTESDALFKEIMKAINEEKETTDEEQ